ncbi:NAD(P)/FAD-dependent oxidoreductase [Streptomyces pactum]|uniref:NAD(P)/FAD-dependent oxidoreductase n=1 Tax=Streptomyces pactum TaxID=68249 RepID=A0ABS0NJD0_9ACTN|nr:NAD(P)/FAD-dependent oxidoreductase [Streptomyces pactum]MBH5335309.1 NAD(P)/FAD-dependent oxidoreductase [Streptomyces pactum]
MADRSHPHTAPVYVVGGGPGGLATAAALGERGVRAVVLERSDAVGASWRRTYDHLRLHTTRRLSGLPGLPIPRSCGRWVSRDDLVGYLERYTEHHGLDVVTGVEVSRVDRAEDGSGWLLHATGGRRLSSPAVVVATGLHHTPLLPEWPGADGFTGELRHAADYRAPDPYRDRDVLVVGAGSTGTEIAVALAGAGAARVRLAVRTVPHLVRRSAAGCSAQRAAVLTRRLPRRAADRAARTLNRALLPDLSGYGLPRPATGPYTGHRTGAGPVPEAGLAAAVAAGRVEIVPAVESFEGGAVVLADDSRIGPEAVIAATGYRCALDGLVGHLGVLDEHGHPLVHGPRTLGSAPGLHFTGFSRPVSGTLRELGLDARRIARALAHRPAPARPAPAR